MARIALVASRATADLGPDGPLLSAAFEAVGLTAEIVPWGAGPDWASFDAVVVRNSWDYVLDREAFLDWAADVSTRCPLANSVEVLEWNTDKRYLRDLQAAGVPTVPTVWVECRDRAAIPDWDDFVVKPSVSAGARLSARYRRGEDIEDHIRRIHATGAAAMIQPYVTSVDRGGETGTYIFGGEVSHAISKGAVLRPGEPPVDDFSFAFSQSVAPAALDQRLSAFGLTVLEAAPDVLYARVDTAPGADGEPMLLELEAAEPYLFLEYSPAGAGRFARAVDIWFRGSAPAVPKNARRDARRGPDD